MLAIDLLKAYGLKPKPGAWFFTLSDEPGWITVHPHGEGTKGQPVLLEKRTGEILGGLGGKFNGQHISALPQHGAHEEHGAQALITWYNKTQKGKTATGGSSSGTKTTQPIKPKKTSSGLVSHATNPISSEYKKYYPKLQKTFSAGSPHAHAVWQKYEKSINVISTRCTSNIYFWPGHGIQLSTSLDSKGSHYQAPFEVTAHEGGHAIDYEANGRKGHFSYDFNNHEFPDTIKKEVSDLIAKKRSDLEKEFKGKTHDEKAELIKGKVSERFYNAFKDDKNEGWFDSNRIAQKILEYEIRQLPDRSRSGLSDILEGATECAVLCGYGHNLSYWRSSPEKLPAEAFANMMGAHLANKDSLATLKKYLPKSCAVFDKMLADIGA